MSNKEREAVARIFSYDAHRLLPNQIGIVRRVTLQKRKRKNLRRFAQMNAKHADNFVFNLYLRVLRRFDLHLCKAFFLRFPQRSARASPRVSLRITAAVRASDRPSAVLAIA